MSASSAIRTATEGAAAFAARRAFLALAGAGLCAATAAWLPFASRGSRSLVGKALPAFELNDFDGRRHSSREFAAAPLVINVWASWCPPCRAEMAGLGRLYEALAARGLRLVGVSVDDDINLAREYRIAARLRFPLWHDPGGLTMTALLGTSAIPATLLCGGDGKVVREVVGEQAWDEGIARGWVEALLA